MHINYALCSTYFSEKIFSGTHTHIYVYTYIYIYDNIKHFITNC